MPLECLTKDGIDVFSYLIVVHCIIFMFLFRLLICWRQIQSYPKISLKSSLLMLRISISFLSVPTF
jgi:hypothetical protein